MSLVAREVVWLVPETTYGTYDSTALATSGVVLHLPDGNSQGVRAKARRWRENSAAGSNRPTYQGAQQFEVSGNLNTRLFPSQAGFWLPTAFNLAGSVALNLKSFSLIHKIVYDDNSAANYALYTGLMVKSAKVATTNQESGMVAKMDLSLIGQAVDHTKTVTDFPEPTFVSTPHYPTDNPFVHEHLSGHMTINGSRTRFSSFDLMVDNELIHPYDEGRFIGYCRWAGRKVSMSANLAYLSASDRTAYEAVTAVSASAAFYDGTNTLTFDCKGRCYFTDVTDDLPFVGDGYRQKITIEPFLDLSLGTPNDFAVTLAP